MSNLEEYTEPVNPGEKEMSFLDHLEELRWHLVRSCVAILVFAVIAFLGKDFFIHELLLGPTRLDFWTYRALCDLGVKLNSDLLCITELPFIMQSRKVMGQFTIHLMSSLVIGLVCAFPYVFWEIWRFVQPGLYPNERNLTRGAVFFVSLLFLSGVLFGYYIISPLSINFLSNYNIDPSIANQFDISNYFSLLITLVLACGIMFQLPIVVYFLTKAGLVTPELMKRFRRHAIVVIFMISAIISPPDVFSQFLIAIPLILLYQVSISISKWVIKKEDKEESLETTS